MGLFSKKRGEKRQGEEGSLSLPELPELPELTNFEDMGREISQLPTLPNNSLGEKFSRSTIKNAVNGESEGEEVFDADEFGDDGDEERMMQKPLRKPLVREILPEENEEETEIPEKFRTNLRMRETEPVFVRLDKFEESLNVFEKTKEKILGIEKLLRDIKKIKEQEEAELQAWEDEISSIKQQIDKIDREIFSKIE